MSENKQHVRKLMLDIIAEPSDAPVRSLAALKRRVIAALHPEDSEAKNSAILRSAVLGGVPEKPDLSEDEWAIFFEVYWDLVIERKITPGLDSLNPEFERFRIHSEYSPQQNG